jgi:suppressor of ftsI
MDRRRFIVTSVSTAALGTALVTDACSSRGGLFGGGAIPNAGDIAAEVAGAGSKVTLDIKYAVTNIKGYKLRTRTFNGRTYGPTIVTRPGGTLSIKMVNQLPKNPTATVPLGSVPIPDIEDVMDAMNPLYRGRTVPSAKIDRMNNPHGFNTTNLHVHGIQTTPHLFEPVGTSNPMADMIEIHPGQSFQYDLPVPANHPSGLHWYHPHKHGSTDVQVSGGMAGLIVVRGPIDEVPEIKAAREVFVVVQTLDVNPSKTTKGVYEREYLAYKTPAEGGYSFGTQFTMITVNGEGTYWVNNTKNTMKPLGVPQFSMQPGEVVRLRFLNGTNYWPMMLVLPGMEAWQIGFDGVNTLVPRYIDMSGKGTPTITPQNIFSAKMRLAMSANRIELLIKAPDKPGTYTLSTLASNGIDFSPRPAMNIAKFVVSGNPVTMGIPTSLPVPVREYPVIKSTDIVARRRFLFNQGKVPTLLTGFGFKVNGKLYQMMDATTQPKLGTCEQWRIENATSEAHPFHLHVNSFQLIAINDVLNDPMEVWDTFMLPPRVNGVNGSITIRIRFVQFVGKSVFHCHILPHEDTGMMANFLIS